MNLLRNTHDDTKLSESTEEQMSQGMRREVLVDFHLLSF